MSAEQCVSIELGGDRIIAFTDISDTTRSVEYRYEERFPVINYHLLRVGYWEGNDFLLVNGDSGAVTVVPGYPVFAPDNRTFAVADLSGYGLSFIQVWSLQDDGPRN